MSITRKIVLSDSDGSGIVVAERPGATDRVIAVSPLNSTDAWVTLEEARDFAAELVDLCNRIERA